MPSSIEMTLIPTSTPAWWKKKACAFTRMLAMADHAMLAGTSFSFATEVVALAVRTTLRSQNISAGTDLNISSTHLCHLRDMINDEPIP
jgi:hypothetical protein